MVFLRLWLCRLRRSSTRQDMCEPLGSWEFLMKSMGKSWENHGNIPQNDETWRFFMLRSSDFQISWDFPSGNLLHSYWKWPFIVDLLPLKMVIFHSYVSLPEGNGGINWKIFPFSHGLWENKKNCSWWIFSGKPCDRWHRFFSHRWFSNVKKGPHGPRVQESKPRIADTSRNAWLYGSA